MNEQNEGDQDFAAGMGGEYEIINGKRVLVHRTAEPAAPAQPSADHAVQPSEE